VHPGVYPVRVVTFRHVSRAIDRILPSRGDTVFLVQVLPVFSVSLTRSFSCQSSSSGCGRFPEIPSIIAHLFRACVSFSGPPDDPTIHLSSPFDMTESCYEVSICRPFPDTARTPPLPPVASVTPNLSPLKNPPTKSTRTLQDDRVDQDFPFFPPLGGLMHPPPPSSWAIPSSRREGLSQYSTDRSPL